MSNKAISGVGTQFCRYTGSVWEELSQINSISGPDMSRETIDTTTLNTLGGYRTFIAGFRSPGTISLSMNYTREAYDLMKADFEDDDAQNYQIILPDAEMTTFEFEGFVTEVPLAIPTDDKITMEVSIQVTGKVDVDSASSTTP